MRRKFKLFVICGCLFVALMCAPTVEAYINGEYYAYIVD